MDRPGFRKPEFDGEEHRTDALSRDWGDDWVHELIAMTRPGVDFRLPARLAWERQVPFEYDDFS